MKVPLIISNHPDLEGLAKDFNAQFFYYDSINNQRSEIERQVLNKLKIFDIKFAILAKYMQILSESFLTEFSEIINIHHSFLPSFKGASPYKQAYKRGVKLIGATAHFVTSDLDEGPIIEQDVARVTHVTSSSDMVAAGRDVERIVLFRAVKYFIERRVLLNKNKTIVFN